MIIWKKILRYMKMQNLEELTLIHEEWELSDEYAGLRRADFELCRMEALHLLRILEVEFHKHAKIKCGFQMGTHPSFLTNMQSWKFDACKNVLLLNICYVNHMKNHVNNHMQANYTILSPHSADNASVFCYNVYKSVSELKWFTRQ